jgi:serine phosphatase RsbU (regulator of sigma subunit)
VTDTTDAHKKDFGMERLQRVILDYRQAPAADVIAALEQAIGDFADSTAPFDDIAMVMIKCLK